MAFVVVSIPVAEVFDYENDGLAGRILLIAYLLLLILLLPVWRPPSWIFDFRLQYIFGVGVGFVEIFGAKTGGLAVRIFFVM